MIVELEKDIGNRADYVSNIKRPHMLLSALKDLNAMIGNIELKNDVANQVDDLIDNLKNKDDSEPIMLHTLLYGVPGTGKCLGKNTPVMMYDGKVNAVQDIVPGNLLMGDDSKPRNVLSITTGTEMMYKIKQKYGDDYIVNESHILSLKLSENPTISDETDKSLFLIKWFDKSGIRSTIVRYERSNKSVVKSVAEKFVKFLPSRGTIIDIELKDYINRDETWKSAFKGYKVGVEYPKSHVPIDPYFLGIWFGNDGLCDETLSRYFKSLFPENQVYLDKLDSLKNKRIPLEYLTNSKEIRLEFLAGILDISGYYNSRKNSFSIIKYGDSGVKDILHLSRSLGFKSGITKNITSGIGSYNVISIEGNISNIPIRSGEIDAICDREQLIYDIEVVPLEEDRYYGFEIDGNNRFLLGDFTVTHNTTVGKHLARIWYSLGYIGNNREIKRNYRSSTDTKAKKDSWSDLMDGIFSDDMGKFQDSYTTLMMFFALVSIIIAILGYFWVMLRGTASFMYNTFGLKWGLAIVAILIIILIIIVLIWFSSYPNICSKCKRETCICEKIKKSQELKDKLDKEQEQTNVSIRNDFAVKDEDLIEIVSAEDFIGQYVGWTEKQTTAILQKNKGKVLFIDEAYSLVDKGGGSFGEKALHIINRYMSEHPEELIIIMAGYEDKIKNSLFSVQPGLVRRFMWSFDCKGYTIEELFEIWKLQLNPKTLSDESKSLEIFRKNSQYFPNYAGDTLRLVNFVKLEQKRDNRKRGLARSEITAESSVVEPITPEQIDRGLKVLARNTLKNNPTFDSSSLTPEMMSLLQSFTRNQATK